ncbi:MAG: DUF4961 domain-containing protein [Saprospiraceae bacterium]|nr:DUF4961 domain-containing protein [Saprospiraceae bacterium]
MQNLLDFRVYKSFLLLICLIYILAGCFEIVMVNQPASATVGEEITITVDAKVTGKEGSTLIFGFCAPRAWKARENTRVSFVSSIGNGTMSLIEPTEVDADNKLPWAEQITDRVGFGGNYGEMEWIVFKADMDLIPPDGTDEDNPVAGTITVKTKVGPSNMITQLGYFLGEALWGYFDDGSNSTYFFEQTCLEVSGAAGQAQDLCGPAPRRLVGLETYTFNDLITITFDAMEDNTSLIGANSVFLCSTAIQDAGGIEICEQTSRTEMKRIGPDLWQLTMWPPSFYNIDDGNSINELLINFRDASGQVVVKNVSGNDFQVLPKCF